MVPPTTTIYGRSGAPTSGGYTGSRWAPTRGARVARDGRGPRGGRGPRRGGGRRVPPGGRRAPPPAPPPRIIQPASLVATRPDVSAARQSEHRDRLRQHQQRMRLLLGSAEGGPVNYQEGGKVKPPRPGHAEDLLERGPNPYPPDSYRYRAWETKYHQDPPPPPAEAEVQEEEGSWLQNILGIGRRSGEELEDIGQARGGSVGYQMGGLAQMSRPRGGVPPWVEPEQAEGFQPAQEIGRAHV